MLDIRPPQRQLAQSIAGRAAALTLLFVALKLYLIFWYRGSGVHPLEEIPRLRRLALCGSDLLAVAAVACVAWLLAVPAMLSRSTWARRIWREVLPALAFAVAATIACVSLKVNQICGRPMSFDVLHFASGLGAMRDSVFAYADAPFIASLVGGVALTLLAPRLLRRPLSILPPTLAWALILGAGIAGGASAFELYRNVYAFGLKSNPVLDLARSYRRPPTAADYAAQLAELDRALGARGDVVLRDGPLAGPSTVAGRPLLHGAAAGRNLVVVVLESSSAAYVNAETAPTLTRLAAEGLSFRNHFTTAPFTFTAQYAIYYSDYVPYAGFNTPEAYGRPPAETSLFEAFHAAGYRTGLFCSAFLYFANLRWLFHDKGVDEVRGGEELMRPDRPAQSWGVDERLTVDALDAWIGRHADEPFFAVYNPVTPHHPYHAPLARRPFPGYGVEDSYKNALYYADERVADLVAALARRHLDQRTVIVVVSDHGESIESRHGSGHGFEFSASELRVPFIVHAPGLVRAGDADDLATNHLDVAPTLASMFGLPAPPGWTGRDLFAADVPRRALFVGRGVGNHVGVIDGGVAFESDLNERAFRAYAVTAGAFAPTHLPADDEAAYRASVSTFEDEIRLRHLRKAVLPKAAHLAQR